MNKAYLLIGGNLGDRQQNLETARTLINEHCGTITNASSIYETGAWGNNDQPAFLNQVVELETKYNAKQLIRRILKTEKNMGRVRKEKYGPRNIDIDILLFNDEQHNYSFLNIPHPELHNRRFALVPLAEIAPDAMHNVFKKTISELLEECKDDLFVRKIKL
jgi:2-amino-4-hydroxy-6-hydroxymethyldihydropteridine diphosphokinase